MKIISFLLLQCAICSKLKKWINEHLLKKDDQKTWKITSSLSDITDIADNYDKYGGIFSEASPEKNPSNFSCINQKDQLAIDLDSQTGHTPKSPESRKCSYLSSDLKLDEKMRMTKSQKQSPPSIGDEKIQEKFYGSKNHDSEALLQKGEYSGGKNKTLKSSFRKKMVSFTRFPNLRSSNKSKNIDNYTYTKASIIDDIGDSSGSDTHECQITNVAKAKYIDFEGSRMKNQQDDVTDCTDIDENPADTLSQLSLKNNIKSRFVIKNLKDCQTHGSDISVNSQDIFLEQSVNFNNPKDKFYHDFGIKNPTMRDQEIRCILYTFFKIVLNKDPDDLDAVTKKQMYSFFDLRLIDSPDLTNMIHCNAFNGKNILINEGKEYFESIINQRENHSEVSKSSK